MTKKRSRKIKRLAAALLISSSLSTAGFVMPRLAHASDYSQDERAFQAYANSRYNYCDAKMVAALWGWDTYQGKLRIGDKILYGISENIEVDLRDSRQRGYSCSFEETHFTYADAQRLSAAWGGRISVWDAKVKIAAFVTAGQTSEIQQQINGHVPGADTANQGLSSGTGELPMGTTIGTGGWLASSNGQFFMTMQQDGNLVVYQGYGPGDNNRRFVWGSVQAGGYAPQWGNYYAVMQNDGNFVVYRGTGPNDRQGFVWGTVQDGHYQPQIGKYSIAMANDGKLMVYRHEIQGSMVVWTSR